jgi:FAD synthetase
MRKVLVFGTFDIFHKGHESYFRQARKFGNYLIVVVARDKTICKVKGELPINNEKSRLEKIIQSGLADEAVLGSLRDKYAVIKKIQPDSICLGYDQIFFVDKLQEKLFSFGLKNVKIKRLKAYKANKYKSSKLKAGSRA